MLVMKFAYEDLSDKQFEDLVTLICQRLFGLSVQPFAPGPDGGRDARFEGTADQHPSKSEPGKGKTMIQAKHTMGINKSFSETDIYSEDSQSTIIAKEVLRIKNLKAIGDLDNYVLFSNRRLTGNTEEAIRSYISEECEIPSFSIKLYGIEAIELWLKSFPEIANAVNLEPFDTPLIVSPNELAEVVELLASSFSDLDDVESPPVPRTNFKKKNELNNMSDDYADLMRKKYLKQTVPIHAFFAAPENWEIMETYESIVEEFQEKIIAKRKDYHSFDEVMNYLMDLLFSRDAVLRQRRHKKLTKAILFYMYWNCDIGKSVKTESIAISESVDATSV